MNGLEKYLKNEEFLTGLVEAKNPEELQILLDKNGIILDEGLTIEEAFKIVKDQENSEFSEEDLENVSGGIGIVLALTSAGLLAAGAGALCFLGGYAYQNYKNWRKK